MATILVKGKPWEYEETSYYGSGRIIDNEDAKYVLLTAKKILESNGIWFSPIFGTLLGLIRNQSFIPNDYDMDILIKGKDRKKLIDLIPDFAEQGIFFTRSSEPWVYTFQHKSVSCDFYAIQEPKWPYNYRYCKVVDQYIQKDFFKETEKMVFFDKEFNVPKNPTRLLEYMYGKNWRVPQKGQARVQSKLLLHLNLIRFIKRVWSYIQRHLLK